MSDPDRPSPPDPQRLERFLELVDLLTPHAIRAAVTLGLPRLLDEGTGRPDRLGEALDVDPEALASLLAHLAERGLVTSDAGTYALSELGRLMLHPEAERALEVTSAVAAMDLAWAGLHHTLTTGEPGYPVVHGRGFWDHLATDTALGASFDEYMHRSSTWTRAAATAEVWPAAGTVVDVAGGDGRLLVDLLTAHPDLHGVLVEQPATAQRARQRLVDHGLGRRVQVVSGSFFDPLPTGGDVYVLGHVLHDWPDEEAIAILRRVAAAAGPHGRVVLVEQVLDRAALTPVQSRTDLLMRVLFGSRERTREDWAALAAAVDLRLVADHPCDEVRRLVELAPAQDLRPAPHLR